MLILICVFITCKRESEHSQKLEKVSDNNFLLLEDLEGTWELYKVNDTLFFIENLYSENYGGQPRIIIKTQENIISGFTGCNSWGTQLNILYNSLVLKNPIEITQQGCRGNWESDFLNNLSTNNLFEFVEKDLKLTSRNQETMIFRKVEN